MNVFDLRDRLVSDYQSYTRSFIKIRDPCIIEHVDRALGAGAFWPEPLLQLNAAFLPGGTIDDLTGAGTLDPECARIFRIDKSDSDHTVKQLRLHTHQREAIAKAKEGKSYVLTSGTGSRQVSRHPVGAGPTLRRAAEARKRWRVPNVTSRHSQLAWSTGSRTPRFPEPAGADNIICETPLRAYA